VNGRHSCFICSVCCENIEMGEENSDLYSETERVNDQNVKNVCNKTALAPKAHPTIIIG